MVLPHRLEPEEQCLQVMKLPQPLLESVERELALSGEFRLAAPRPALELAGRWAGVSEALAALPEWTEEALHETLLGMAEKREMKNGTLLWPVRIALAGKQVTPGGAIEIAALLGREKSLRRLNFGRAKL